MKSKVKPAKLKLAAFNTVAFSVFLLGVEGLGQLGLFISRRVLRKSFDAHQERLNDLNKAFCAKMEVKPHRYSARFGLMLPL